MYTCNHECKCTWYFKNSGYFHPLCILVVLIWSLFWGLDLSYNPRYWLTQSIKASPIVHYCCYYYFQTFWNAVRGDHVTFWSHDMDICTTKMQPLWKVKMCVKHNIMCPLWIGLQTAQLANLFMAIHTKGGFGQKGHNLISYNRLEL